MTDNDELQLDSLLNRWADESAAPERVDRLRDRIVNDLTDSAIAFENEASQAPTVSTGDATLPVPVSATNANRWSAGIAMTLTVSALASLLLLLSGDKRTSDTQSQQDVPPQYAWLGEEQLNGKALLFAELDGLFDQKLSWVVETGDELEFGIADTTRHATAVVEGSPLAIRVVVEKRKSGQTDWELAWATDVVSRNEEFVSMPRDATGWQQLQIWAYRLPDGLIAIDSELHLHGQDPFHAATSTVQHNGTPTKVATKVFGGTEYRVFQTAAVIGQEVG